MWAAVEGGVMCVLLLMSHDFPVFTTLQNMSVFASEMRNECVFFPSVWIRMVRISQQSEISSLAEVKLNFFLSRFEEFSDLAKQD